MSGERRPPRTRLERSERGNAPPPTNLEHPSGSPPTRLEASSGTPATRLEREHGGGTPLTHLESGATGGSAPWRRVNLPPQLASRYDVDRELEALGAEADLLLVVDRINGERRVVKLYRQAVKPPSDELIAQLRSADAAHVVQVFERGHFDGTWCEVMEYCEPGSLAELANEAPLAPALVHEIVAEVNGALLHLHEIGITHRDLKPANILIRTRDPLDLVLTDFGLATLLGDMSLVIASERRTVEYAAPEAAYGRVNPKMDWWSLGVTIIELLTGHRPFGRNTGDSRQDHLQTSYDIAHREIDLSEITDPRLKLLVSGLTAKTPEQRWGDEQVRAWARGESPRVQSAPAPAPTPAQATTPRRATAQIAFRSPETGEVVNIDDPLELGEAMGIYWNDGLAAVSDSWANRPARQALRDYLFASKNERAAQLLVSNERDEEWRLLRLRLALDPEANPYFRGQLLNDEELVRRAYEASRSGEGVDFLGALLEHEVLRLYANTPERDHWRVIDVRWRENVQWLSWALNQFEGGHVAQLGPRLGALVLQLLLDPAAAERQSDRASELQADRAAGQTEFFPAALQAIANGPQPARDLVVPILHDRASRDLEELRGQLRRRQIHDGFSSARVVAASFAGFTLLAAVAAAALVLNPPSTPSSAPIVTALLHTYPFAIGGAVAVLLGALLYGAWVSRSPSAWLPWRRLLRPLLWTSGLVFLGFLIVISDHQQGATAPRTTGGWMMVGFAAGQLLLTGAALFIGPRVISPAARWIRRLVIVGAAAAGVIVGAIGIAADASAEKVAFAADSQTLAAAAGRGCAAASPDGPQQPRAWLRGEARCRSGPVNVRYLWLPDQFEVEAYAGSVGKINHVGSGGDNCASGNYNGGWGNSAAGADGGPLICYSADNVAHVAWANYRTSVFGIATRRGALKPLAHWWEKEHNPGPTPQS